MRIPHQVEKNLIRIGNVLVVIGVSMWGLYAVGKYLLGWDITGRQFLSYHLAMIIPGMMLRHGFGVIAKLRARKHTVMHGDTGNSPDS